MTAQTVAAPGAGKMLCHGNAVLRFSVPPGARKMLPPGKDQGIQLEVVKHTEAKPGFVLLPRRWVVERTFGWLGRFRRLAETMNDWRKRSQAGIGWRPSCSYWLTLGSQVHNRL